MIAKCIQRISKIQRQANRLSLWSLLPGLFAVAGYNWRIWRREREQADQQRTRYASVPQLSRTPKISVLVAAWNEAHRIENHIRSFQALDYPERELVLCAGGPDGTFELASRYASEQDNPPIIVLEQQPGEGKQRSLARCMEYATGEIIHLTDADCTYDKESLKRLLAPIVEEGEQITTGGTQPLAEQRNRILPWYLWASDTVATIRMPLYHEGLHGANAAITRQALEQSGGMDFSAPTGTDYQLAKRLVASGFKIRQVSTSFVPWEYSESFRMHRRRQSRWLRNLILYGHQYGAKDDVVVTIKTVSLGVVMVSAPVVAVVAGPIVGVPWGLLAWHAVCSKLRYVFFTARLSQQRVPPRLLLSLIPLTLLDFVIWAAPVRDLLQAKRRKQW